MSVTGNLTERDAELRAFTYIAEPSSLKVAAPAGPLAGLAVAVKEIIDVAGMPVTYGSPLFADRIPDTDAEAVRRLKAAGAVIAGMTTTTPFACGTTTVTRNPHRLTHTPGGSSAGSGAAVGGGLVPVALASQSQASTLRPASYCGTWGYKPSHLRLPRAGMHLLSGTLDDLGLVAADLDVLEKVLAVLADDWRPVATPRTLRVGLVRLDDGGLPRPETLRALDELVHRLDGDGITVVRTDALRELDELLAGSGLSCFEVFAGESADVLEEYVAAGEPDPRLREMVSHADPARLVRALRHRAALITAYRGVTADVDVLLTLSTTNPAPAGLESTGCRRMPATSSLLGVPALSAPWLTVDGLPQGVQLVGRTGGDEHLLAAARALAAREEETR